MDFEACASTKKRKLINDEVFKLRKKTILVSDAASEFSNPSGRIQWIWHWSADPFSESESVEWHPYSDVENMIIEEAFTAGETHAMLDNYYISFQHNLQITNDDLSQRRPVKRLKCNGDEKRVRTERFLFNPIAPRRPYGGLYGFISPFIKEVAKELPKQT